MAVNRREPDWVLLGQAGYSEGAISALTERMTASSAFDDQQAARDLLDYLIKEALAGHVPRAPAIAAFFGHASASFPTTTTARLRDKMCDFYRDHSRRDDIHLAILPKSYIVVAERRADAQEVHEGPPLVRIIEPADNSEVSVRVTVRGKIERLDPDLRVWMIVRDPGGFYYLQSRVSRRNPMFECHTRTGRVAKVKGALEGTVFVIMLVGVDADIDWEFHRSVSEFEDAYGRALPKGTQLLASVTVIRRDNLPSDETRISL